MDDHENRPESRRDTARMRAAGLPFLCCGIVFMAVGIGKPSLMGIGLPMLTLGIVFLAQSRRHQRSSKGD